MFLGGGQGIVAAETPQYALGWQLNYDTRLLIFEKCPLGFSVNLVEQIEAGSLCYIIPPMQFHFISPMEQNNFICIDIARELLDDNLQFWLQKLEFRDQKSVPISLINKPDYKQVQKWVLQQQITEKLLALLEKGMHECAGNILGKRYPDYEFLVERFIKLLRSLDGKLDQYNFKYLLPQLDCCERALHRACIAVLGIPPKKIVQQQTLLCCLFALGGGKAPLSAIASEIGFADQSSFSRFIKQQVGLTPNEIRKKINV